MVQRAFECKNFHLPTKLSSKSAILWRQNSYWEEIEVRILPSRFPLSYFATEKLKYLFFCAVGERSNRSIHLVLILKTTYLNSKMLTLSCFSLGLHPLIPHYLVASSTVAIEARFPQQLVFYIHLIIRNLFCRSSGWIFLTMTFEVSLQSG